MSSDKAHHSTFAIERKLATAPERAYCYFADAQLKDRWNGCHPDWTVLDDRFEFRVGGGEAKRWRLPDGKEQTFDARYFDIVEGKRIVYAFDMSFAGERVSVSLATVEFAPAEGGTSMLYTEQMVYLADAESRHQRVAGTGMGFDRLVDEVARAGD